MDSVELASSQIPEDEITHLLLTLTDAFHLAADGESRRGYLKVLGGLVRLGQLNEAQNTWARDLQAHWKRALKEYLERHPEADLDEQIPLAVPRGRLTSSERG